MLDYNKINNTVTQQQRADYVSRQIGTYHYTQLDEEKAKVFNEEIKSLLSELQFIALDECSFYPNLDPRFGYSFEVSRVVSQRLSYKGKYYTLLFDISSSKKNGVVHWKLIEKSANWKILWFFGED